MCEGIESHLQRDVHGAQKAVKHGAGQVKSHDQISWPHALARQLRQRGEETTRKLMCKLLRGIETVHHRARRALPRGTPIELLCLIDLVQDLEVILPVALAARQSGRYKVSICMTTWLHEVAPWVPNRLASHGFQPILATRKQLQLGQAPDLEPFGVLLTACESTAAAHRFAHALVRKANQAGLHTFTLQHGLENLGLTSRAGGDPEFASQGIFTWRAPRALPPWVPAERRDRCIGVGRARLRGDLTDVTPPSHLSGAPFVAVFENLHWERYPPDYTSCFLADLLEAARRSSDLRFVIRPHPAGLWLTKNPEMLDSRPSNLIIASPVEDEWRHVTANTLISRAVAVVTTPSTVTLDAALLDVPVAVAAYGLDLEFYSPLPTIESVEDWVTFIRGARGSGRAFSDLLQTFQRRHLVEGDACERILDSIAHRAAALQPA